MSIICVAGKNDIAISVTDYLLKNYSQYKIVIIPNKNDSGKNGFQQSFRQYAERSGLETISLEACHEINDLVFLSLEFDRIIKPSFFRSKKLFNIHFSLLPAYKGMYTSAWPLLNGEVETGVTLHEIDKGIDTGNIIAQRKFQIENQDTARSIYLKYISYGSRLVIENLDSILKETYSSVPQQAIGSSYYSKSSIKYGNLQIDLNKTASEICRQIRAFTFREYQLPVVHGYPVARTSILESRSYEPPGTILQDTEEFFDISSIDYDLRIYKDYYSQLWRACETNNFESVQAIRRFIPDLEVKTKEGWTALIIAAFNCSLDVADFLLREGADVNAVNYNGTSVLMYAKSGAIQRNSNDTLKRILKAGPLVEWRDIWGKTVLDYVSVENPSLYKLISEFSEGR